MGDAFIPISRPPSPRGGMVLVASYTGEGLNLGGIIRIPWLVSEAGLGVLFIFFLFLFSLLRAPMPLGGFVLVTNRQVPSSLLL